MKKGFEDGLYAAISYGKSQLIVLYNGEQLEAVNTPKQARDFIANHKTGTELNTNEKSSATVKPIRSNQNDPRGKTTTSRSSRSKVGSRSTQTKNSASSGRKTKNKLS